MNTNDSKYQVHHPARPLKVVVDKDGCNWLCDSNVDEDNNLAEQGCWRCSEVQFNRND